MVQSQPFFDWMSRVTQTNLTGTIDGQVIKMQPHNFSRAHSDYRENKRHLCLVYFTGHQWQRGNGGELVMNRPDGRHFVIEPTANRLAIFSTCPKERHSINALTTAWSRYTVVYWLA